MTALWDRDVNHEVPLEDQVVDLLEEAAVDIHELPEVQLVGSQEDHLEAEDRARGNHQGRAEEGREEE